MPIGLISDSVGGTRVEAGRAMAVLREPEVVGIGLHSGDAILRCPRNKEVMIIRRSLLTGPIDSEAVLTGGWLEAPALFENLVVHKGRKFFQLQKANPTMSAFLTGKHPRESPLATVRVFSQMKARLKQHCNKLMIDAENTLANNGADDSTNADPTNVYSRMQRKKKRVPSEKRSHHTNDVSRVFPNYDVVDMSLAYYLGRLPHCYDLEKQTCLWRLRPLISKHFSK